MKRSATATTHRWGTVRTHVANLRRKCREAGLGEVVRTRARRGYVTEELGLG